MTTVLSRKELSTQTAKYVLVQREDIVYQRVDSEYIPKRYFTSREAADLLDMRVTEFQYRCRGFIQAPMRRGKKLRLTLDDIRKIKTIV